MTIHLYDFGKLHGVACNHRGVLDWQCTNDTIHVDCGTCRRTRTFRMLDRRDVSPRVRQ